MVTVTSTREIVNAADGVTVVVSLLSNGKTSVRLRDDDSGNFLEASALFPVGMEAAADAYAKKSAGVE